jgi:hypothetical protein
VCHKSRFDYLAFYADHPYEPFWTRDAEVRFTLLSLDYLEDSQNEDAKTDKAQRFVYYQDWMSTRMGDINLVLDTALGNAKEVKTAFTAWWIPTISA